MRDNERGRLRRPAAADLQRGDDSLPPAARWRGGWTWELRCGGKIWATAGLAVAQRAHKSRDMGRLAVGQRGHARSRPIWIERSRFEGGVSDLMGRLGWQLGFGES